MMIRGEGFKKRIQNLIDARLQSLVSEVAIKTSGAGPGRGHKGRSHKKISLSLPKPLYMKVKELDGFFSCHVASALELYLKFQKGWGVASYPVWSLSTDPLVIRTDPPARIGDASPVQTSV